jgi:histidine triad (HIT) family protein
MKDCIFCKLANGEIPTNVVYEDDIVTVFMDANPNTDGHMLIVPKKHIEDFTEIDSDTLVHVHEVAKKMKDLIYEKLGTCGLKIVNNYGSEQLIKHYHVHLIPVYEDTDFHYQYVDSENINNVFEKLTK